VPDEEYVDHDPVGLAIDTTPPPEIDTRPLPEIVEWRVPRRATWGRFGGAAAVAALSLFAVDLPQVIVALVAAAGLVAYAVRDLVAPVRLRLDPDGVVAVRGYAGRRAFPWSVIESVRLDSRLRLGIRAEAIELDAGDDILVFGATDLGVPVREAVRTVERFRARAAGETGSR